MDESKKKKASTKKKKKENETPRIAGSLTEKYPKKDVDSSKNQSFFTKYKKLPSTRKSRYVLVRGEWLRRLAYFTKPEQYLSNPRKVWNKLNCDHHRYFVALNLTYIASQIKRCIFHQDWEVALQLLFLFMKQNLTKCHLPFLIECIHAVLLNHPLSNQELCERFESLTSALTEKSML